MKATIKAIPDFKDMKMLRKKIKNMHKFIKAEGAVFSEIVKESWEKGKAQSRESLQSPPISPSYRKRKRKLGEKGRITMLSGEKHQHMRPTLKVQKVKRSRDSVSAIISVDKKFRQRLLYNLEIRPQIMNISYKRKFSKALKAYLGR